MNRCKLVFVTSSTCLVTLLMLGAVVGHSAAPEDAYKHLSVYTEVLHRIKSDYVEEPDMKNVTLGAVNGLLEAVDPFASYLSADQYKQYLKSREARDAGVGLVLSRKYGYIGVVEAIPGSPAAKAGLSTGDMLEAINGISTRDMPLAFADVLLHGQPNTTVEISVLRVRKPEPQKITLNRAAVKDPPVTSKTLEQQIAYVQVPGLEAGQTKDVAKALVDLQKQGARKLVLDLRNSATGSPEEGIALANLFLEQGIITYVQGQKVVRQDFTAEQSKALWRSPLVVITNRGTAAGAEVTAAALLDNKRGEVVGERTYGNAALRKAITMDDGAAVILAVAKYYSPKGKAIQDNGVTPSVPLQEFEPAAEEDEPTPETPERKPAEDALLKRAVEVLTKGVPQAGTDNQPAARGPENPQNRLRDIPPLQAPPPPKP
jgi:carboxyl-terminal processing protease